MDPSTSRMEGDVTPSTDAYKAWLWIGAVMFCLTFWATVIWLVFG
jgi:hypothetical protein